jgi:uncharacterized hydrophobic protein (TIGR00341 family)
MNEFINILELRRKIAEDSYLYFDFYNYIICACVIAACGLLLNNNLFLVASMLISPIMRHILALTFGIYVWDYELIKNGFKGVTISFIISLLIGFIFGIFHHYNDFGITNEMIDRTNVTNLYWSCIIAIFSGFALVSSIVEENVNNLVGVAISTSILPPCVNAGILLTISIFDKSNTYNWCISLFLSIVNILLLIISSLSVIMLYQLNPRKKWFKHIKQIRNVDLKEVCENYENVLKDDIIENFNIEDYIPDLNFENEDTNKNEEFVTIPL